MWREMVERICDDCSFFPPADKNAMDEVEAALGTPAPDSLLGLWRETDGVKNRHGGIWSVRQAVEQNLELRSYPEQNDLYMSFETMFCFADAGNGDLFFFPVQADGKINRPDVFVWEHETDNRKWVAANLEKFVEQWFHGAMFAE